VNRTALAWVAAQGGRDPYIVLVSIYVFAPWFVSAVVGNPVEGQALVAAAGKWGGWAVMASMPVLGAAIDRIGPRKPLLALVTLLMIGASASLWFVTPRGHPEPMLGVNWVILVGATMTWALAAHDMLHNALLVPAAGIGGAARASGAGLAAGNAVGVSLLLFVLLAFVLPGTVAWLPGPPLFGIDPALGEPARLTGPLAATCMLLGSWPLFLWVPDRPRTRASWGDAFAGGIGDLVGLFRNARGHANVLLYLVARMIYTDALTAILLFGGVFASGVMGWGTLEMLGYGLVLSAAAVAGGLLAGRLDGSIGPRPALMLELAGMIIIELAVIGTDRSHVAHIAVGSAPVWNSPVYASLPELGFLALGCGLAITVTAAYASSRTLLTRLAPPEQLGTFFGLYALSGSATMWLGPLLVEIATRGFGTQQAGFWPIVAMLALGLMLMAFVKGGGRLKGG
jgi:UMF1 family MFS transporter